MSKNTDQSFLFDGARGVIFFHRREELGVTIIDIRIGNLSLVTRRGVDSIWVGDLDERCSVYQVLLFVICLCQ